MKNYIKYPHTDIYDNKEYNIETLQQSYIPEFNW
jgi:hypothetical protein